MTWNEFRDRVLAHSKSTKAIKTHYRNEFAFRAVDKYLPLSRLSQMTPEILTSLLGALRAAGVGIHHANRTIQALKAAMRQAERWGWIQKSDWSTVKKIKTTRARVHFWTPKEISEIIQALREPYKTIAFIAARTGMRLGEIYHLSDSDIDWRLKRIHVCAKDGWNPKDYEIRFIPMPEDLAAHLKGRRLGLSDKFKTVDSLSAMIAKNIRRIGFEGTAHKFRHSYASHLVMAGVPIYTVSKLLGHSSVTTTEQHYAHLSSSHLDTAIQSLPALSL
jgi:integrase